MINALNIVAPFIAIDFMRHIAASVYARDTLRYRRVSIGRRDERYQYPTERRSQLTPCWIEHLKCLLLDL